MKATGLATFLALATLVASSPVPEHKAFKKRTNTNTKFDSLLVFGDSLSDDVRLPYCDPSLSQVIRGSDL
jgi:hypothetical protein